MNPLRFKFSNTSGPGPSCEVNYEEGQANQDRDLDHIFGVETKIIVLCLHTSTIAQLTQGYTILVQLHSKRGTCV